MSISTRGFCFVLMTFLASSFLVKAEEKAFVADKATVELWNFDADRGVEAVNDVPSGTSFAIKSSAETPLGWTGGKFGGALHFQGKARLAANSVAIPLERAVTVEAWIKVDESGSGARMGILQYMIYRKSGFRLEISAKRHLVWSVQAEGRELSVASKAFIYPGDWIHVAGTYDGESLRVYVNGDLSGEVSASNGNIAPATAYLLVGYADGAEQPYFCGLIDAIRISNVARKEFLKP
ncbi:MAG: hypothetical protein B9S32_17210 [Verrucomicrobia bacterium Tous-C9LFEB]|nr:MAG: hypothetical protein B9S32_17210 [Verrucomicrobia bacterium Tous-C9LFEB]